MTTIHPPPLRVPSLWCPIPEGIHPDWERIDERSLAWADRFGLCQDPVQRTRLSKTRAGELICRIAPRAVSHQALQLASDCGVWLFAFDDAYCDEGVIRNRINDLIQLFTRHARVVQLGSDSVYGEDPYQAALADLRRRLTDCASPSQVARWEHAVRSYLFAEISLAAYRRMGTTPSVNDYSAIRMDSSGVLLITTLLDVTDGVEVDATELHRPDVRALTEMSTTLVAWDNDIFSHRKESVRSQSGQNLVDVVAAEHGRALPDAMTEVITMRNRVLHRYLELRAEVGTTASPQLDRYLDNCDSWIRANIDWSVSCDRYVNANDGVTLSPPHDGAVPAGGIGRLDIPSIAWWWTPATGKQAHEPAH